MNIDVYSYTNTGSREINEDSYGVTNSGSRFAALVCDGLGGHQCGEVASQAAKKNILDSIAKLPEVSEANLQAIMKFVNDGILQLQEANPAVKGMRTTAVGCVIEGNQMTPFNCGDSRFYYFSNGTITCMSKDHSVSQMSVSMGEMSFDAIRDDPDRNKLLKVLGEATDKTDIGTVYPPINCKSGDAFLLCSDGFWEYVIEEEMEIDLSKSLSAKEWIEYMLVRLLLRYTGNNDNFTVIGGIIK